MGKWPEAGREPSSDASWEPFPACHHGSVIVWEACNDLSASSLTPPSLLPIAYASWIP